MTQKALSFTMRVRQPPEAWYDMDYARTTPQAGDMYHPRRIKKEIANGTRLDGVETSRVKRGALAIMGTLASSLIVSELWPLISDKPLFVAIGDWLESIFYPSSPDRDLERRVMELFNKQRNTPSMKYSSRVNDPSLDDYLDCFMGKIDSNVFLMDNRSRLTDVALMTPNTIANPPNILLPDSMSSNMWPKQKWYDDDYLKHFCQRPCTHEMVADYTHRLDALHYMMVNLFKVSAEVAETTNLIEEVFSYHTRLVTS